MRAHERERDSERARDRESERKGREEIMVENEDEGYNNVCVRRGEGRRRRE